MFSLFCSSNESEGADVDPTVRLQRQRTPDPEDYPVPDLADDYLMGQCDSRPDEIQDLMRQAGLAEGSDDPTTEAIVPDEAEPERDAVEDAEPPELPPRPPAIMTDLESPRDPTTIPIEGSDHAGQSADDARFAAMMAEMRQNGVKDAAFEELTAYFEAEFNSYNSPEVTFWVKLPELVTDYLDRIERCAPTLTAREAQDVILSRHRPVGLSAMNILEGRISAISSRAGDTMVVLQMGEERLLARVTCRAVATLGLQVGDSCHAIMKSVALAPGDIS